jgi:hypothetical protein
VFALVVIGGTAYLVSGLIQDVDERGFDRTVVIAAVAVALMSFVALLALTVAVGTTAFLRRILDER